MRKFLLLFATCTYLAGWSQQDRLVQGIDLHADRYVISEVDPFIEHDLTSIAEINQMSRPSAIERGIVFATQVYETTTSTQRGSGCFSYAGGPYTDLLFPPCENTCGSPLSTGYQVWGNEAYIITGTAGSQYTFEFCNGYSAATWPAFISVGAYNGFGGVVPGSEIASVSGCSITFTTPLDKRYIIVVSVESACGGPEIPSNNGFATIDCGPNGASCYACTAGTLAIEGFRDLCPDSTIEVGTNNDQLIPTSGGYGWNFAPGPGGSGGPFGGASFSFGEASPTGNIWGNDLDGSLGDQVLEGRWIINGFTYDDANDIPGTVCESTPNSLQINFADSLFADCLPPPPDTTTIDSTCRLPTYVEAIYVSPDQFDIYWDGGGTPFHMELVNLTVGEFATGIPTDSNVTSPYQLSGLAPSTTYELYIYGYCPGVDLLVSGVLDATLPDDGLPKMIELYAFNDIEDLSEYGVGSANNGEGSDGVEFVLSGSILEGENLYISSTMDEFVQWFGFEPDFVNSVAEINGDDAVELFKNDEVVDVFGEIDVDGTGEPWEYTDGWAYRYDDTGPDGDIFVLENWYFSGPRAILVGDLTNATCNSPIPFGSFTGGGGGSGAGALSVEFTTPGPGPSCMSSAFVSCTTDWDLDGSTASLQDTISECSPQGAGFWFNFVGNGLNWEIVATPQSSDIAIQLFNGSCDNLNCLEDVDNSLLAETLNVETVPGQRYYMYIGGKDETVTSIDFFNLLITCIPVNDTCVAAITTRVGTQGTCDDGAGYVLASTIDATESADISCNSSESLDIWYKFTANSESIYFSSIEGNPGIELFDGSCGSLGTSFGCLDNESGVLSGLVDGNDYYAVVWTDSQEDTVEFCLEQYIPESTVANDSCGGAVVVTCDTDIQVDGSQATTNGAPRGGCSTAGAGLWYTFEGDGQDWEIVTTPMSSDIEIQVLNGECHNFSCAGQADNSSGEEALTVSTVIGNNYLIYIGGIDAFAASIDSFDLSITCSAPIPDNDLCFEAATLNCSDNSISGTTISATANDFPTGGCSSLSEGVWYTIAGTGDDITIDVHPDGWDPELDLSSGSCGALTHISCADNGGSGTTESVSFYSFVEVNYYLYVSDWSGALGGNNAGDFTVDVTCVPPTCEAPTNLLVSGITSSTAVLSWTPGEDETSWDIEIVDITNGGTFTGTPTISDLSNPFYLATGLDPENEYEFYVLADCGFGESDWVGPESFETLPDSPANDLCADAIPLVCNAPALNDQTTVGAIAAPDPLGCASEYGVWYTFTGDGGDVTVRSANPTFNHELDIFSSDGGCNGTFSTVVCRDGSTGTESATFTATNGTQYFVYVAHFSTFSTTTGTFDIELICIPPFCEAPSNLWVGTVTSSTAELNWIPGDDETSWNVEIVDITNGGTFTGVPTVSGIMANFYLATGLDPDHEYAFYVQAACGFGESDWTGPIGFETLEPAPVNNTCEGAIALICDEAIEGSTATATTDGSLPYCGTTLGTSPGVWYSFTGNGDNVTFSLCGSSYNTKIGVFTGSCDGFTCETGEDNDITNCGGNDAEVSILTAIGTEYLIYVTGANGAAGDFTLGVNCVTPPPNNVCGGAIAISCDDLVLGSTIAATSDASLDNCGTPVTTAPGVWYSFVGTGDDVTFSLCSDATDFDSKLGVYEGSCGNLICVDANDDACGTPSEVEVSTINGVNYYIYVTGFNSNTGNFGLSVTCVTPTPLNQVCASAIEVICDEVVYGSTVGASTDVSLENCGTTVNTAPGVWYSFTGTGDDVTFSLCDDATDYDSKLAVYTGACAGLICVDANNDACGSASELEVSSVIGSTYFVYVTGSNANAGNFGLSVTCVVPSCDTADIALDLITDVVCGNDGAIDVSVSGGSGSYEFLWSNEETTEDISGLVAGDYTLEATDADDGCPATATFTVGGNDALEETSTAVVIGLPCDGSGGTASIDVTIGGGMPPYTFSWSNGESIEDLSGLGDDSYTLTVTDANNCMYTSQTFVIEPAGTSSIFEVEEAVITDVDCFGNASGSIDISLSGGIPPYTIRWNNDIHTEDIGNIEAGEYVFTAVDATGCEYTSSIFLVGEPYIMDEAIDAVVTDALCNGGSNGSIDINIVGGTPPYTYLWTNGSTVEDPDDFAAGSHQATVTDANGCVLLTENVLVGEPSEVAQINASVTAADCYGAETGAIDINVSGGTPGYSFVWSNTTFDEDIQDVEAGDYSVFITDANGCSIVSETFIVGQPAKIQITATLVSDADCNGASTGAIDLSVNGGSPPYTYEWNNGGETQDISGLPAGTYTVIITDINDCFLKSPDIVVGEPIPVEISAVTIADADCQGAATGSIDITPDGGNPPYIIAWSNGSSSEDLSNAPSGDYSCVVTDFNGCQFTSPTYTIGEPDELIINTTIVVNLLCNGDDIGSIDIEVAGGTLPYSYLWNNSATSQDLDGLFGGDYTVVVTDGNSCTLEVTIPVLEPLEFSEPVPPVVTGISCHGETDGAIDLTVEGGTSPFYFIWSNGASTEDLTDLSAGDYTYVLTDTNGCVFELGSTSTIIEPDILSETAVVTDNVCFGGVDGSIDITVSGGTVPYTYIWNTGAVTEDLSGIAAGDYSVDVEDANGCTLTSIEYTVTEPNTTALEATIAIVHESESGASDGSATVTASGGDSPYTYEWADGFGTNETISNLTTGIYCVEVTDANGCRIALCGTVGRATGVEDLIGISEMALFPNPTSGKVALHVSFINVNDAEVAIVDVLGKVQESVHFSETDEIDQLFDMTAYAAGTYFFRITTDKHVYTQPLIVHH